MVPNKKKRSSSERVTRLVGTHYNLKRDQGGLDFVNVDLDADTPLFVAPEAIRTLPSSWGDECVVLLQSFFAEILVAIRGRDHARAHALLAELREPNETRLGLSKGRPRGRGVGTALAEAVWSAMRKSKAVSTGALRDLEDTLLMIEGVGPDMVSDMTTNVIRGPLVSYTQERARVHGLPMSTDVYAGPHWDPLNKEWRQDYVELPVVDELPLILVPKIVVRSHFQYNINRYYRSYIIPKLQAVEMSLNTGLVRTLKDGRRRVDAKAIEAKYGRSKALIAKTTQEFPDLLTQYKTTVDADVRRSYRRDTLAVDPTIAQKLFTLRAIPAGNRDATRYHLAAEAVLTALFAPDLTRPVVERQIHEGRKRVDIVYVNEARTGFFDWLRRHYPCAHLFVECKNYTEDPRNPELDQLSGRFSPQRGRVGLLLCRSLTDKALFVQRCRDTAQDDRGWILPIDDDGLGGLVQARQSGDDSRFFAILKDLFDELVM